MQTEQVHPYDLKEGDRIIYKGKEVTFLNEYRPSYTLSCGCCSDYYDHFIIEYQDDDGVVDDFSTECDKDSMMERVVKK